LASEFGWAPDAVDGLTVRELNDILNSLTDFIAIRDYKEWSKFAFLAATMANLLAGKKGKAYEIEDFIGPPPWQKKKQKTKEEMREELEELKKKLGGDV